MAPKKRPAAAVASKFGSAQSREIKLNPRFAPMQNPDDLEACHLIPVAKKDDWIPKMTKTFGQDHMFWSNGHSHVGNGVALTGNLHAALDASSGPRISFLPDLIRNKAKNIKVGSKTFLLLYQPVAGRPLSVQLLFANSYVEDIEKSKGGFVVQFHGGVRLLINLPVPECFKSVSSFFKKKKEKGEIEKRVSKLSDIKAAVKNALEKEVVYSTKAKRVDQTKAKEALSALGKDPKSIRMVFCFDADLPFYTVRGLQARSLRLLEHEDFKDLPNGRHFSGDDFSEESTEEDRSGADEDAQRDLLLRACRDSATLSGLFVEQSLEPRKKRQKR